MCQELRERKYRYNGCGSAHSCRLIVGIIVFFQAVVVRLMTVPCCVCLLFMIYLITSLGKNHVALNCELSTKGWIWKKKWKYTIVVSVLKTQVLAFLFLGVLRKMTKDSVVAGVQLSSELGTLWIPTISVLLEPSCFTHMCPFEPVGTVNMFMKIGV